MSGRRTVLPESGIGIEDAAAACIEACAKEESRP